ncbi:MAG: response regulator transcription factor, partial [Luteibaculum sp.]
TLSWSIMKRKLGILDDEPSISMIIELNLSDEYSIHAFQDKESFDVFVAKESLDALILDLNLAGNSGKDVITEIRNSNHPTLASSIPIIILSGEDSTQEKISCLNEGADDYLVKPFNPMELKARMNRIFSRING